MNQSKQSSSSSVPRRLRGLGLASMVTLSLVAAPGGTAHGAARTELPLHFSPTPAAVAAVPPLPSPATFPVQLVVDDDAAEGTVGVAGATARQFLWFNRFTPGGSFDLEETWVLFPAGDNMAAGAAVQLAIYQDADGNPANGATLLATFDEVIQAVDGNTFSIYSTPVSFDGLGDLLIGVVPRFIVSGVTTATGPAAIDTGASQGRSWLAIWSTDPPNPPSLTPPPDVSIATVDGFLPGNWMIRGFGTPPPAVTVPTLGEYGLILLALALALAATLVLRRRGRVAAAAVLLALAFAGAAEAQVTIDTFTTNQATLNDPPGGSSSALGGADIIGTRRGLVVDNLLGAGPTSTAVAGGNLSLTVSATTPDSRGEAQLTWDGDANPLVLTPTGLGGVDLTATNASGFRLRFVSSTVLAEVELTVYGNGTDFSRAARRVPASGSAQDVIVPFSEFRIAGGTGADFSSVGAVTMTLRSGEGNVVISEITTTVPTVAATKVDAQINDLDLDTRVDPGDRLRYTITVTNTGNEALNVALADTIDNNTMLVAGSVSSTPIARNDQYLAVGNVTLNVDGTPPGLLANDSDPDGDTVTVQAVVSPTAQGGTVTLVSAATGTFTYAPPVGFKGVDSFTYTIVDDNANLSTATATIALGQIVWFIDDSNTTPPHLGTLADPFQVLASVSGAGGAGDADLAGDILFVFDDDGTPYAGGIELEADQTLLGEGEGLILNGDTIVAAGNPPQITNAAGVGVLLSTNNTLRGFDVQATAGVGIAGATFGTLTTSNLNVFSSGGATLDLNNGNLSAAFATLSSTGGSQRGLLLDTVTGSLNVITATSLTNPLTHGIRVVNSPAFTADFGNTTITDNAIGVAPSATGIDIASSAGASFTFDSLALTTDGAGLVAASSGTINIAGVGNTITATNGAAVDLTSMSLGSGATFTTLSSSNSTGKGANLDTVTGSFVANGGVITGAAGIGFDLNAGSSTVTYAGSITNTANALLIDVTGRTGGTTTFSGTLSSTSSGNGVNVASNTGGTIVFSGGTKTLNTGADAAVTLATNTGATINFTGGGLDIDTTSGTGFNATGGATAITVQGTGNSITSTTGTALNVASTTIGAADLTFQSISSNGGTNGIVLNTTGSTGNLVVTGTGSAGTGGTIQNKATGISLTSTNTPSFSWMQLNDFGDFAIRGSSVVGFNLDNSVISGVNGNNAAADDSSVRFTELTGSATVTNCNISGGFEDNFKVVNSTGTLNRITFSGVTIGANSTTDGNDGIAFESTGSATVLNATIQNSFFTSSRGDLFQMNVIGNSTADLIFTGNALSNNHPGIATGGGGVTISGGDNTGTGANFTMNMANNTFRDSDGHAILFVKSTDPGTFRATFNNNQIGVAATADSGSRAGSGIKIQNAGLGTVTVAVTNNTIRQYNNFGIEVTTGGGASALSGAMNATITGNTVANPGTGGLPMNGVHLNGGTVPGDTYQICMDIGGAGGLANALVGSGANAGTDFRLRQRQATTVRLPGYAGANNNDAAVVTFIQGRNTGGPSGLASNTVPTGGGFVGGAACPLP
jgi:hypothetical protein